VVKLSKWIAEAHWKLSTAHRLRNTDLCHTVCLISFGQSFDLLVLIWLQKDNIIRHVFQIDALGSQALNATVPMELASLRGEVQEGSGNAARKGFQRFGGVLLIFTGVISAYTSSQVSISLSNFICRLLCKARPFWNLFW